MEWQTIVSIVLAILAAVFGGIWAKVRKVFKEASELLITLDDALKDEKITKEEIDKIMKEGKDVIETVKALRKKS